MIVWGTNLIRSGKKVMAGNCPNCDAVKSVEISNYQGYIHIFWIPFIPSAKLSTAKCNQCGKTWEPNDLPDLSNPGVMSLKDAVQSPLWTFSGLLLVLMLIAWGIVYFQIDDKWDAKQVLYPKSGDIYEIKTEEGNYTLYKVEMVIPDVVFVRPSMFEVDKAAGLYKLEEEAYSDSIYPIRIATLKQMYDKGELLEIERDE